MGEAQQAIEDGFDPFMSPDGHTPWEETELGYNPRYHDEPELYDFNYEDEDNEERLEELKIRLVELEINIKKMNDEKEYILNELIALLDKNEETNMDSNINNEINISDDEIPF